MDRSKEKFMARVLLILLIATVAFLGCFLVISKNRNLFGVDASNSIQGNNTQLNSSSTFEYWADRGIPEKEWYLDPDDPDPELLEIYENVAASYNEGVGFDGNVIYYVWTAEQFAFFFNINLLHTANYPSLDNGNVGCDIIINLIANIDLSERSWAHSGLQNYQSGNVLIIGNGFVVNGIYGNALYGDWTGDIEAHDFYLSNVYISKTFSNLSIGAFANQCSTAILDCCGASGHIYIRFISYLTKISVNIGIGGLIGRVASVDSKLIGCFSYVDITFNDNGVLGPKCVPIGGIVGQYSPLYSTTLGGLMLSSCYANSRIEATTKVSGSNLFGNSAIAVGGLIGYAQKGDNSKTYDVSIGIENSYYAYPYVTDNIETNYLYLSGGLIGGADVETDGAIMGCMVGIMGATASVGDIFCGNDCRLVQNSSSIYIDWTMDKYNHFLDDSDYVSVDFLSDGVFQEIASDNSFRIAVTNGGGSDFSSYIKKFRDGEVLGPYFWTLPDQWLYVTSDTDVEGVLPFFPVLTTSLVILNNSDPDVSFASRFYNNYVTPLDGHVINIPGTKNCGYMEDLSLDPDVEYGARRYGLKALTIFRPSFMSDLGTAYAVKGTNVVYYGRENNEVIYTSYRSGNIYELTAKESSYVETTLIHQSGEHYENGRDIIWVGGCAGTENVGQIDIFNCSPGGLTVNVNIHMCFSNDYSGTTYTKDGTATSDFFGVQISYLNASDKIDEIVCESTTLTVKQNSVINISDQYKVPVDNYELAGCSNKFNQTYLLGKSHDSPITYNINSSDLDLYIYVALVHDKQIYVEEDGYQCFDCGSFAQSYVTKPSSSVESKKGSINYLGADGKEKSIDVVLIGSNKYAKVTNGSTSITLKTNSGTTKTVSAGETIYFKFEPIKWAVHYRTMAFGQGKTNFNAISKNILMVSALFSEESFKSNSLNYFTVGNSNVHKYLDNVSDTVIAIQNEGGKKTTYKYSKFKTDYTSDNLIGTDTLSVSSCFQLFTNTLKNVNFPNYASNFTDFSAFVYAMENNISSIDARLPGSYWAGELQNLSTSLGAKIRGEYLHALAVNEAGDYSLKRMNIVSGLRPICQFDGASVY